MAPDFFPSPNPGDKKAPDPAIPAIKIYKNFLFQALLDKYLIAKASNAESKVFYLKMKGDYYR